MACNRKEIVDAVLAKLTDVDDYDKPVQLQNMKETLTVTGTFMDLDNRSKKIQSKKISENIKHFNCFRCIQKLASSRTHISNDSPGYLHSIFGYHNTAFHLSSKIFSKQMQQ